MLNRDQISFYRENGYLVIEDAIAPEQLEALVRVTGEFIDRSRQVSESNDVFDLDAGHNAAAPRLTRIKLPHMRHPIYWDTLTAEPMTARLTGLLGPDVRLHTSKLNTKAPGGGAAVEWHQDWAFYPHTNDDLLAVGLMLEDVGEENGPLMVVPGSHKGPVLDHASGGVFCGAVDPADPLFDFASAATLTGRAGTISLHHVRTLHGSAANMSDRVRLMLFYECGAADAWPINGNSGPFTGMRQAAMWDDMQKRMICGSQPRFARLEPVPVVMPVPPAPDSTSIFKVQESGGAVSAFSGPQAAWASNSPG